MENLPSNCLTANDTELLQNAGSLVLEARDLKENPSKLRLKLVDIQAMRFEIGRRRDMYKGHKNDLMAAQYGIGIAGKLSRNAAYKEAEMNAEVIKYKNTAQLFETAFDVMDSFVNINQSSLRLATEEAKNNL